MEKELVKTKLSELYGSGKLGIAPGKLSGDVFVPQSKSAAHRALIMAFQSGDIELAKIDETIASDDIKATKNALITFGKALSGNCSGKGGAGCAAGEGAPVEIDCKESGSTLRFLIPLAAVLGIPTKFIGSGRLPQRPIKEYEGVFKGSGAEMIYLDETGLSLPLLVKGKMQAGTYSLPGNVSSQYISGLLMALSNAEGASKLLLTTELESRPYVDLTCEVMRAFGVEVEEETDGYSLKGENKPNRKEPFEVEADYSQAAFWLVADYLGSDVKLTNLPKKTAQGDRAIVDLLSGLAEVEKRNDEAEEKNINEGKNTDPDTREVFVMDARDVPDLVPVFSVAAAATNCITKIVHAERLRIKESDRIASTAAMLTALGVQVEITEDGLCISGQSAKGNRCFSGGTVDSCKDHRLVMAAAVAAIAADGPVWIRHPVAVEKSYPSFFEDYLNLGGKIHGINVG